MRLGEGLCLACGGLAFNEVALGGAFRASGSVAFLGSVTGAFVLDLVSR